MKMLRENLSRFDALGMPTYLESSNRANNPKYESLGYVSIGEFTTPGGGTVFNAGVTDWTCGLGDPAVERITKNVLDRLSA